MSHFSPPYTTKIIYHENLNIALESPFQVVSCVRHVLHQFSAYLVGAVGDLPEGQAAVSAPTVADNHKVRHGYDGYSGPLDLCLGSLKY